jgi:hypothetical protein
MLLSLMRIVLTKKMLKAAGKNSRFANKMKLRNFIIAIVTEDGKTGIHFIFKDGNVTSGKGDHTQADARLIWSNSLLAFKVLVSQNDFKMARALFGRKLTSVGDVNMIVHFKDMATEAMS